MRSFITASIGLVIVGASAGPASAASEEDCARVMPSGVFNDQRDALMAECMAAPDAREWHRPSKSKAADKGAGPGNQQPRAAKAPGAPKDTTPVPDSWAAFLSSKNAGDAKVVARIQKMEWWQACEAWGRQARTNADPRLRAGLLSYLQATSTINGLDVGAVTSKKPEIGMTTCGVFAQLGRPATLNQTERAGGYSAQMVYRERGMYVYTEGRDANAKVRSIQF